jgi:hypothetical protein
MPTLKAIHICNSHQPTLRQKLQKSMSLPTLQTERKIKYENTTMYIKNRRNSNKFMAFGSYQTLCLTESFVLRNRLLFIY